MCCRALYGGRRSVKNPMPTDKKTAASLMAYSGYCYEKYFLNSDVPHSKSSTAVDLYFLVNKRFPALNTMINIADISNVCPPLVIILFPPFILFITFVLHVTHNVSHETLHSLHVYIKSCPFSSILI